MGYLKIIKYSNIVELYQYEKELCFNGRGYRGSKNTNVCEDIYEDRSVILGKVESKGFRRADNARRAGLEFRRLVSANLGISENPLLVSLTYREIVTDPKQANADFNSFARIIRSKYGSQVRYVAVKEFQKRGAIHFHALFWGLPNSELVRSERTTRVVASYWGKGFVDVLETDGDLKIAGYLSKYMSKTFSDSRLSNSKAYIGSRNLIRPVVEKGSILLTYFWGDLIGYPDLSNSLVLQDVVFSTSWLGSCRYRKFSF